MLGLFQAFCLALNNCCSYPFLTKHCIVQLFPFLLLQGWVYLAKALGFNFFSIYIKSSILSWCLFLNYFSLFPCPHPLVLSSQTPLTNPCFGMACQGLQCLNASPCLKRSTQGKYGGQNVCGICKNALLLTKFIHEFWKFLSDLNS